MLRKTLLSSALALVFVVGLAQAALAETAPTYKVGDKVEVLWKGTWYPAAVIEVKPDEWKIHYDGYEASWDEWVKSDRIRMPGFKVGDAVEVLWKGTWYPAQVIEAKPDEWKIHYDGYESSWDEWVKTDRIRRKP